MYEFEGILQYNGERYWSANIQLMIGRWVIAVVMIQGKVIGYIISRNFQSHLQVACVIKLSTAVFPFFLYQIRRFYLPLIQGRSSPSISLQKRQWRQPVKKECIQVTGTLQKEDEPLAIFLGEFSPILHSFFTVHYWCGVIQLRTLYGVIIFLQKNAKHNLFNSRWV